MYTDSMPTLRSDNGNPMNICLFALQCIMSVWIQQANIHGSYVSVAHAFQIAYSVAVPTVYPELDSVASIKRQLQMTLSVSAINDAVLASASESACRLALYKLYCTGTVLYCIVARRAEIILATERLLSHIDNGDYDDFLSVKRYL